MSNATPRTSENFSSSPQATYGKDTKLNEKTSRATSAANRSAGDFGQNRNVLSFLADISRQQLAVATESSSTLFRGSENMRKIQQETAHHASVRYSEAAEKLSGPGQLSELLPIQAELLREDMQSAGQYWQQLASAAMQTQREMMACMTRMLDGEKSGAVKSALDVFQSSIPALATSFFHSSPNRESEHQPHDS